MSEKSTSNYIVGWLPKTSMAQFSGRDMRHKGKTLRMCTETTSSIAALARKCYVQINSLRTKFRRGNIKHKFINIKTKNINPSSSCTITYLFYIVNGCWCPGDARSQGISNHDTDLVKPRWLGPRTLRVKYICGCNLLRGKASYREICARNYSIDVTHGKHLDRNSAKTPVTLLSTIISTPNLTAVELDEIWR